VSNFNLYFPAEYTPSKQQKAFLQQIHEGIQKHKFIICSAPTGSGKSLIAKTIATALAKPPSSDFKSFIESYDAFKQDFSGTYTYEDECLQTPPFGAFTLTITKSLQDQYFQLLPSTDIVKGKSNYICNIDDNFTVDLAPCTFVSKLKDECCSKNGCLYYNARNKALLSEFAVLNYKMFFSLPGHVKRKNVIICDEASELEEELVRQFSADISYNQLEQCEIQIKKLLTDNHKHVLIWVSNLIEKINLRLQHFTDLGSKNLTLLTKHDRSKYNYLLNLQKSLTTINSLWSQCEYVVDYDVSKVSLTPLHAAPLTKHIFNYADKIILMSATIVDHKHFAKSLGIKDYCFIEGFSNFDPSKSPIYISNQYKLNYKNLKNNLPKICNQIESILSHHQKEKGIIHTHTQEITNYIQTKLGKNSRLLFRDTSTPNEIILKEHYETDEPTVLVSPSLAFGIDLKDDLARFQIIVKLPFLPLSSKRIKLLVERDQDWYTNKMLSAVVQATGRATRSKTDHSKTYILDSTLIQIIKNTRNKLPKHFIERIH